MFTDACKKTYDFEGKSFTNKILIFETWLVKWLSLNQFTKKMERIKIVELDERGPCSVEALII